MTDAVIHSVLILLGIHAVMLMLTRLVPRSNDMVDLDEKFSRGDTWIETRTIPDPNPERR